ncbi:MAG TPA: TMEM165/GDT1 family protein [Verrucomicrobiae bacterium]|nr:TMEM165/GDT1 family protein [Verrucomicrobiae bacterium]
MHIGIILLVFAVIFIAELPDKSLFASLILGSKFPALYVWLGCAAAFLVHVIIAVLAGQLLTLLPHLVLHIIVGILFLAGALLIFFGKHGLEEATHHEPKPRKVVAPNFWKVFGTSFTIIFLGEWGDITQISVANYTAHYHDSLNVGIGATLGLWAACGLAVTAGSKVISRVPAKILQRTTGVILILFAIISFATAVQK